MGLKRISDIQCVTRINLEYIGMEYLLFPVMRKVVGKFRLNAVMNSSHSDSGIISCRL